jgi:penicillin-insensitive murein endopeptidase
MNAVRMPAGEEWSIGLPEHAYGTDETIAALVHCIRRVAQQYPNTPRIAVGSISAERGGPLPPHKSHRTGRDADVALYYKDGKWRWDAPAGAHNLDTERTWAFLRTLITESDVEFVLIDNVVLTLLEEHALSIGEDAAWVHELFHGDGSPYSALVKHAPGHTAHMHVRFVSPLSRERARLAYDKLVEQGHVLVPVRDIEHKVVAGETLTDIARRYGTTVSAIRALNRFDGDSVEAGRLLRVAERQDVRGARDSVVVPPRKLPRQPTPQGEVSRTPAVAATATRKGGSRYSDDEEGKLRRELDELERQLSAGE